MTAFYPPKGFVYLHQLMPGILYELRYYGNHNFTGRPLPGYHRPVAILSLEAAKALRNAQITLERQGYQLKVFDAYRPQKAVNAFIKWAKATGDTLGKKEFYPQVDKRYLFQLGYIASKSGHSRGSTADLTIIDAKTGVEMDMGGYFDFFGDVSHQEYEKISPQQKQNRLILKSAMENAGFRAYSEEWWHFPLRHEPYPDTYFDFDIW